MIERSDDLFTVVCDDCGTEFAEAGHFDSAIADAKSKGEVRPDGEGGWEHRCRPCARDARIAAQRRKLGF